MKRKVAIIIERTDTALGGAETSVSELAEALSERGLEVSILAANGQTNAPNTLILFPGQTGRRTCYFAFAKALKKHLSENHYDIIHSVLPFEFADVYQPRGGSIAESVIRNAASYENKAIGTFKKVTAFANLRRTMLLRAERRLCENPSGPMIAALSEYVARQFREHYGVETERIAIIPNGVKTDKLIDKKRAEALRTQVFTQLGIKETEKCILFLFAANNFRLKGLACLIRALHLAAVNNAYLLVVGRDRASRYQDIAVKLGIGSKVIFLGQMGDIQNVLSIADVAALPTFYDPSSRFVLEGLAAGKPVITTKFNGAADLFVNKNHGSIIESPENIEELARAIKYFSEPANIRKATEAIAADNLKEKISIGRAASQMEALYNTIIDKRRWK